MSFRYKSALLSLVSLVLVYGWYFGNVIARGHRGLEGGGYGGLVATVFWVTVIQIVGHVVIAILSPDRRCRLDERERAFDQRATTVGYYALICGLFGIMPLFNVGRSTAALANSVVLLVVAAECARQAVFLIQHHRATC
jgi:uncharacterized membrane protein